MKIQFDEITVSTRTRNISIFDGEKDVIINKKDFEKVKTPEGAIPISKWVNNLNDLKITGRTEHKVNSTDLQKENAKNSEYQTVPAMPFTELQAYNFDSNKKYRVHINQDCMSNTGSYDSPLPTFLRSKRNIIDVIINNDVNSIGVCAFSGCNNLTSIEVSSGNNTYSSLNGVLYNKDQTTLIQYPIGKKDTTFDIPNSVVSISDSAFSRCENLTSINISDGVTSIGSEAFFGCDNLTEITIPDSVTSIGDSAFSYCSHLTSVNIPNGVTSISYGTFEECSSLTSVRIPDSVTFIGEQAFNGCSSLTSITIPDGVTSIGGFAFQGCSRLTSVNIPDGVTSIGSNTFNGCWHLTSVTIPKNVTSIKNAAFGNCSRLTSINIPDSVTSIGEWAFNNCVRLTSATIGNGVTSIGENAFVGCDSLTSVTIPNSVTSIGKYVFEYCKNLISITYTGTQEQWNAINIDPNVNIPSGCIVHCTDGDITIQ